MKNIKSILAIAVLFLSLVAFKSQLIDYKIGSDFTMKIKGSSNVHDWESNIETLTGTASVSFGESGDIQITDCKVSIPVQSIKSSKGSRMDKKTMKALNETEYPNIEFALVSFGNVVKTNNKFTADAKGNLTVAGEKRTIDMVINGTQLANGSIEIECTKDMKMTDFNIKPPTALLGTMRTHDEITIEFKIVLNDV
jgi:polyisoprenoid-binding protein YceI